MINIKTKSLSNNIFKIISRYERVAKIETFFVSEVNFTELLLCAN